MPIITRIGKFFILLANNFLSFFKLIIVPIHYYTPLTELKIIPNHKLLEKADFSKINYNQNESILFLKNLEEKIGLFLKFDHFKSGPDAGIRYLRYVADEVKNVKHTLNKPSIDPDSLMKK